MGRQGALVTEVSAIEDIFVAGVAGVVLEEASVV